MAGWWTRWRPACSTAAEAGTAPPDAGWLVDAAAGPLVAASVVFLLVGLGVEVGFLKRYQATPGKLALGLRVRKRHDAGPLTWGTAMLRWCGKAGGPGLLQLLPFGRFVYLVYVVLDYLWPLGDRHRQALHDKVARTYVVRRA